MIGLDMLVFILIFLGAISIFVVIFFIIRNDKKKETERIKRCTFQTTGILLRVLQQSSTTRTSDGYDSYSYYPVIQYQYDGKLYEKEYHPIYCYNSEIWTKVQLNTDLIVFVNPMNVDEIYVPRPNHKNKIQ